MPEGQPTRNIDEIKSFTLNATNVCGGSSTQNASFPHHRERSSRFRPSRWRAFYYPTDYPDQRRIPQVGLVKSQQLELSTLAAGFQEKYLEYDPDAKLSVEAHADDRGSKPFNQDLSERRVERIKQFLVDQGITADKIQTAAFGKDQPLDKDTVKTLESSNPNTVPPARLKSMRELTGWRITAVRISFSCPRQARSRRSTSRTAADDSGLISVDAEASYSRRSRPLSKSYAHSIRRRGASVLSAPFYLWAGF